MKGKQNFMTGIVKKTVIGVTVSLGILLTVCAIGAAMVSNGSLEETSMGYLCAAAILSGGVIGAWTTVRGEDSARLLRCAVHGASLFLALLCMGTIIYDTAVKGVGATVLLCVGGSLAVGLFNMRKKGRRAPGKRRYKMR